MVIAPLQPQHLPEAAQLFTRRFHQLRQAVPILPDAFEDPSRVAQRLTCLVGSAFGVAAFEGNQLVGYLTWVLLENFRGAGRKAAYSPEWGHAALEGKEIGVYRALYRAASQQWAQAGCQIHALTLLARDRATEQAWFWNGFGLLVVDAVRPMLPVGAAACPGLELHKAASAEAATIAELDFEHCQHYAQAPIFMAPPAPDSPDQAAAFMAHPQNSYWLAVYQGVPAGFLKFEAHSQGAADILESDRKIAITGAFVRPEFRGRRIAPALLDAAQIDYAAQGYTCCSVDFESFNPEAASFWPRYFEPVCLSVARVPET